MRVGACDGVGMGGCGQTAKNDGESHCECCLSVHVRVLSEQRTCPTGGIKLKISGLFSNKGKSF